MSKSTPTQKQEHEQLVALLREWQELEDQGIRHLCRVRAQTRNRLLRQVLSVIMHDSAQHRRIQAILLEGLTTEAFSLTPEEVGAIWTEIEEHDKVERASIEKAVEARKSTKNPIVRYFLSYLLADEEKHHRMLEGLEDIKRNLYPYGW
jgi:hypothetical protein